MLECALGYIRELATDDAAKTRDFEKAAAYLCGILRKDLELAGFDTGLFCKAEPAKKVQVTYGHCGHEYDVPELQFDEPPPCPKCGN